MTDHPAERLVSVVIPAHNEAEMLRETITDVVAGLRERGEPFEVIVVENGSTDTTWELATTLSGEFAEVSAIQHPAPDYGRSLRAGFLAAHGDAVVNFDADYYDLDFLAAAVERVRAPGGPVVVVGSKRGPGAKDSRGPARRLVTGVFTTVLRRGFGLRVSDTHGIKAMRREPLVPIAEQCKFGTDLFDTELILRAERAGLPSGEIPVVVEERRPSRSSIARRIPRTIAGLVTLWWALRREAG